MVRAQSTGCYDALEEAELTGFIGSRKDTYDVIVSADTLCYFGDLQDVMFAVAEAVRPGGFFIFTVERGEEGDDTMSTGFRINPLGRYSHQENYVSRTIAEAGMKLRSVVHGALRQEMGSRVTGLVVTAAVNV